MLIVVNDDVDEDKGADGEEDGEEGEQEADEASVSTFELAFIHLSKESHEDVKQELDLEGSETSEKDLLLHLAAEGLAVTWTAIARMFSPFVMKGRKRLYIQRK